MAGLRTLIYARSQILRSSGTGLFLTLATLLLYMEQLPMGQFEARAVAIAILTLGSLFIVWAELAGEEAWWRISIPKSRRLWFILIAIIGCLLAVLYVPVLSDLLHLRPFAPLLWLKILLIGLASVVWRALGAPRRTVR
jgi:magnesium-transporting ATPase (P-type)